MKNQHGCTPPHPAPPTASLRRNTPPPNKPSLRRSRRGVEGHLSPAMATMDGARDVIHKEASGFHRSLGNFPGAPITSIFEGQPPQNKAETPTKTRVIWAPGIQC